jgi:glutamate racemase
MWVPLIENNEHTGPGADYFVQLYLEQLIKQDPEIDTILLGCTHYPLLIPKIEKFLSPGTRIISQGAIVANSLADYLVRHPEMENRLSQSGKRSFFTTDDPADFEQHAGIFFGRTITATRVHLT